MDVNKRIKELMDKRGWKEYRLTKEADLPPTTVANLFKRGNMPTIPTLEAICDAFGLTLSQFFGDEYSVKLTEEQKELFDIWITLSEEQKLLMLNIARNFK